MSDRQNDLAALKARLVQHLPSLVERWYPGGRRDGHRYWPRSTRRDKIDSSICIDISGPTAGRFKDFGDPDLKGDVIDLVAYAEFGCIPPDGRKEAIGWIRNYLGDQASPTEVHRAARVAPPVNDEDLRNEKARKARGLWFHAQDLRGTHGEAYLAARGIELQKFSRHPGAIRFQTLDYRRHDAPTLRLPALVTCMTNAIGVIRAVHMTFLDPVMPRKADVTPPKKVYGDARGCSIRLSRGVTGWTPEDYARRIAAGKAAPADTQVIIEGIEDGLTWALMHPSARVTAAGSLSMIGGAPVFDCAAAIEIVGDNDENPKTRAALDGEARKVKARAGARPVHVLLPTVDKDINAAWLNVSAA